MFARETPHWTPNSVLPENSIKTTIRYEIIITKGNLTYFHNVVESVGHDSSEIRILNHALHRERLSRPRLAIREDGSIVPSSSTKIKNLFVEYYHK